MAELGDISSEMERLHDGDRGAFWSLYRRAAPVLYPLALRILNDPLDARAALADVFVSLWVDPPELPWEIVSPEGWLVTETRTLCAARLRLRTAPVAVADEFVDRPEAAAFGARVPGWTALDLEGQEILLGAYLDFEDDADLAARLDLPVEAILGLRRRALRSLSLAFGLPGDEVSLVEGEAVLAAAEPVVFDIEEGDETAGIWAEGLAGLALALPPLSPPAELQETVQGQLFPGGDEGLFARLGVVQAVVGAAVAAGVLFLWVTYGQGTGVGTP